MIYLTRKNDLHAVLADWTSSAGVALAWSLRGNHVEDDVAQRRGLKAGSILAVGSGSDGLD